MKKILFCLLFLPAVLYAQSEVTFLGIPISLPYEQFTAELSAKDRFAEFEKNDLVTTCRTKFAGLDTCQVEIWKNDSGNIRVIIVGEGGSRYETGSAPKLKALYDEKYGSPVEIENYVDIWVGFKSIRMDSRDTDLIRYTYKKGVAQIDFVIVKSYGEDSEFMILYYPRGYERFIPEDI